MRELSQCDLGDDTVGPAAINAPNLAAARNASLRSYGRPRE